MKIDDRVIVTDISHWLRPGARGRVVEFSSTEEHKINHWLIRFDEKKVGGGINNCELWLNDNQLAVEDDAKRKG